MSSDAQISANQNNSQLSSGPKTSAGKRQSSLNSVTHGFAGHTIAVPEEDAASYQTHCRAYFDEFKPRGINETDLVQELADLRFSLKQMLAVDRKLLVLAQTLEPAALAALNNTSIYYNRKHRAAESTLKQLQGVQSARTKTETAQLAQASSVQKLLKSRKEPFEPAEIGFACSIPQIESYQRCQELKDAADDFLNGDE